MRRWFLAAVMVFALSFGASPAIASCCYTIVTWWGPAWMSSGNSASGSYSTAFIGVGWQGKNVVANSRAAFIDGSGNWSCSFSNTAANGLCYFTSGGTFNKKPYLGNNSSVGYAITGTVGNNTI